MPLLRPKGSPTKLWHESGSLKQLPHHFGLDTKGLWIQKSEPSETFATSASGSPTWQMEGCETADTAVCVPWETHALQLTHQQPAKGKHPAMPQAASLGVHGVSSSSLAPPPRYLRQLQHLVLHQGDKRADDNSCASSVNRRKLVAQAFPIAWEGKKKAQVRYHAFYAATRDNSNTLVSPRNQAMFVLQLSPPKGNEFLLFLRMQW